MKNIFADLYNKVVNFFYKTDTDASNAKDIARSRLKLVLMQDRTNLPPIVMDRMKRELIELLSKYVELDKELLDLNFEQEDNQMALMLSIPVVRAKNDAEIQAIIEKETLEKQRLEDLSIALGETATEKNEVPEPAGEILESRAEGDDKDIEVADQETENTEEKETIDAELSEEAEAAESGNDAVGDTEDKTENNNALQNEEKLDAQDTSLPQDDSVDTQKHSKKGDTVKRKSAPVKNKITPVPSTSDKK